MACAHASCLYSPRWPRSSFASAHRGSRWKLSTESRSWCWSGAWGLHASAGEIRSRVVWITVAKKRIKLRLLALRLSEQQQEKAERRTKRKASKTQRKRPRKHGVFLWMGLGGHDPATGPLERSAHHAIVS